MAESGRGRKWMFLFIMGGVIVLIYSINIVYRGISSYSWPYCSGKIISSGLQQTERLDPGEGIDKTYSPKIVYEYAVNGARYTNDRIFFGEFGSGIKSSIKRIADKYPPGKEVPVYYNPKNPQEAVLEKGVKAIILIPLISGIIFLLIGIAGYRYWNLLNQNWQVEKRENLNLPGSKSE